MTASPHSLRRYSLPQNSSYPTSAHIMAHINSINGCLTSIVNIIPTARHSRANPTTRFIHIPLHQFSLYYMHALRKRDCQPAISSASPASSSISSTSFSVILSSPFDPNLSMTSGIISSIFVIVSWFLMLTSFVCPF